MQPEDKTPAGGETTIAERLTAYLDGEMDEQERHAMETLLENSPSLKALAEQLNDGERAGLRLFEALAQEPVPARLIRAAAPLRTSAKQ